MIDEAYAAHPERFVRGRPALPQLPEEVWINQPHKEPDAANILAEPAVSDNKPGAQLTSRGASLSALDVSEHLATVSGWLSLN